MSMIEVKVSELIGPALDWAVAKAEGQYLTVFKDYNGRDYLCHDPMENDLPEWSPSTNWGQGGALIEKYQMDLTFERRGLVYSCRCENDGLPLLDSDGCFGSYGETHLIASCRAIVAAKLGDVVSVPAELVVVCHAD